MEYNIDNAELTTTLTAVNLDTAVVGQAPLEVAIGESAQIDVGTAINYIESGRAEIAAAVQEGTAAFDLNAEQKTADFNANASNKTAEYNQNASDKTDAFNTNAENQFDDYNANASNKLNAYNDNASDKLMAFDNNAATKTQAYNDNATAKTTAFNDNAAIKQAAVDASADAAAASATTAKQYAIGVPSEPSGYSAKYWSEQAAQSLSGLQSDVAGIKAVIPTGATASNKLTDKGYVDTADNNLQSQIDAITASSDVTDIVGTYAELQSYDTSTLPPNSIIKVLQDESRNNETTYYRWVITGGVGVWSLIGEEGPYYTISAADAKFATQTALSTGLAGKQNTIGDLATIRSGAALGATALQSISSSDVTTALGYTPYNASNPSGYITSAALENYVTTNTAQTITGTKTFSGTQILNGTTLKCFGFERGTNPQTTQYVNFYTTDSTATIGDNTALGLFRTRVEANGKVTTLMRAFKNNVAGTNDLADIQVIYPASGSPYTYAPTPTEDTNNSNQIDTVGARNTKLANYVTLDSEQDIVGRKNFIGGFQNVRLKMASADETAYTDLAFLKNDGTRVAYIRCNNSGEIGLVAEKVTVPASSVANSALNTVAITKQTNGYVQLGNGVIINWGRTTVQTSSQTETVTFSKAYSSNNAAHVALQAGGSDMPKVSSINSTSFVLSRQPTSASASPATYTWIAVGY